MKLGSWKGVPSCLGFAQGNVLSTPDTLPYTLTPTRPNYSSIAAAAFDLFRSVPFRSRQRCLILQSPS